MPKSKGADEVLLTYRIFFRYNIPCSVFARQKRQVEGMFEIGNYVVHVGEGICEISDITMMNVSGADRKYYVLIPIDEKSAKVYIPVDNAEKRVRPVMEKEDARKLIKEIKAVDETLVENEREREKIYKEAISSCDPRCLIGIMKTMYLRRQKRLESGKKSTAMDDRYF